MSVKLLTEQCLELLSLKGAVQAHLRLHMSKCHVVGNHMSRLICQSLAYTDCLRKCLYFILRFLFIKWADIFYTASLTRHE